MSKRNNFLLSAALVIGMSLPALAGEVTSDTVVASVNGQDITLGHLILAREALPEQYQSLPDDVIFEGVLENLIQQSVLSQSVSAAPGQRAQLAVANETRTILAASAIDNLIRDTMTEEALTTLYDVMYGSLPPSKEYNASHILVETEDEAKELIKALNEGADFATLAIEKSTGPSGPNGGELGWFGPGMMVKPFEDAVVAMEKGQISEPVQTQFGWHVITLNDSRDKPTPTMEEVRAELEAEHQRIVIEEAIQSLTEKADIKRDVTADLDPAHIRSSELVSE